MRSHRLFAGLVAGLVGASLFAGAPALGAETPAALDYTSDVDFAMYGVFFEDVNRAADRLYAELIQNRSFENLPVDNGSFTGLASCSAVSTRGAGSLARR